jgi:hypothetical protein
MRIDGLSCDRCDRECIDMSVSIWLINKQCRRHMEIQQLNASNYNFILNSLKENKPILVCRNASKRKAEKLKTVQIRYLDKNFNC